MAKKSNKTEHVLKLITKNDEAAQEDDIFVIDQETASEEIELSVKPPEKKESPAIKAFREQERTENVVPERNDDLVNIAEVLAREKVALVMERMKVCTCRTCVNDVLALALNSLPTKYVTTDAGRQYFQRDIYKKQYETDILAALTKACVRVKASPRH